MAVELRLAGQRPSQGGRYRNAEFIFMKVRQRRNATVSESEYHELEDTPDNTAKERNAGVSTDKSNDDLRTDTFLENHISNTLRAKRSSIPCDILQLVMHGKHGTDNWKIEINYIRDG